MIEKYVDKVDYIDLDGEKRTSQVMKIKGLKFDSKILDIFTDRKLAENFTKITVDKFGIFCLILGIVSVIMIGISYGIIYYFR
jgi:hypothetical protein